MLRWPSAVYAAPNPWLRGQVHCLPTPLTASSPLCPITKIRCSRLGAQPPRERSAHDDPQSIIKVPSRRAVMVFRVWLDILEFIGDRWWRHYDLGMLRFRGISLALKRERNPRRLSGNCFPASPQLDSTNRCSTVASTGNL